MQKLKPVIIILLLFIYGHLSFAAQHQDTWTAGANPITNPYRADECGLGGTALEQIWLSAPKADVFNPTNANAVTQIKNRLAKMKRMTDATAMGRYYRALDPQIDQIFAIAQEVEARGYPQLQTADLVHRFTEILVFPIHYIYRIADYGTGGCSDSIERFNRRYYDKAVCAYNQRYVDPPDLGLLPLQLKSFVQTFNEISISNIDKKFRGVVGYSDQEAKANLFFQYRYSYRVGDIPMMRFIETRETGEVFVGVSMTTKADYDGQRGMADGFARHDYLHAFVQKLQDARLFAALNITSLEAAKRLKALNQKYVLQLLSQWIQIEDPALKAAVEVMLFALLHEQARSYPIQVDAELSSSERLEFYEQVVPSALMNGRFGKEYKTILKGIEFKKIRAAILWLQPLVRHAAQQLTADWEAINAPKLENRK